jgi:hypothetical protein
MGILWVIYSFVEGCKKMHKVSGTGKVITNINETGEQKNEY